MYIEVWDYVLLNIVLWCLVLTTCYYDIKKTCPDKFDIKNKTVIINVFISVLVIVAAVLILTIHVPNRVKLLDIVCSEKMISKTYKEQNE